MKVEIAEEKKRNAIEHMRRRCCMFSVDDIPWSAKTGFVLTNLLDKESIEWLMYIKVLLPECPDGSGVFPGSYWIDRDVVIKKYYELNNPEPSETNMRFWSDPTTLLYLDQRKKIEDIRLWMFFRELANVACAKNNGFV